MDLDFKYSNLLIPPEVLYKIFSSLQIEDKKSVRLVCKRWNEGCSCPAILKREKFVFRNGCYPLEVIDKFLHRCEIRNSVEFINISLNKLPSYIWRIIGKDIHTLTLTECTGSNEVVKNIFFHCSNMHSFRSSNEFEPLRNEDSEPNFYSRVIRCLDELIQLGVKRPQLTDFQMFVGGNEEISEYILSKIFKIFPCVRNFGTGHSSFLSDIVEGSYIGSLRNALNPALIKEISFNLPNCNLWLQEFSNTPELKLQKLETIINAETVRLEILMQFFLSQRELKILKITLLKTDWLVPLFLLPKILSICSELIDFRFRCESTILLIDQLYSILRQVSKSKLECFMLWFKPVNNTTGQGKALNLDNLSAYMTPLVNTTLRTLKLYMYGRLLDCFCLPILKHFCDLRHLELASVSDIILQTIFEYHIHLRTLVLSNIHQCTEFGFTGFKLDSTTLSYSISRLQELTHLELDGDVSQQCVEKTIRELNFPNLKYLRLNLPGLINENDLKLLPTRIPSVEVIIFNQPLLPRYQYVTLSKHLRRLKLILYPRLGPEEIIKHTFMARPTLKYAVDKAHRFYFYDRFSNSLRKLCNPDFTNLERNKSVFNNLIQM